VISQKGNFLYFYHFRACFASNVGWNDLRLDEGEPLSSLHRKVMCRPPEVGGQELALKSARKWTEFQNFGPQIIRKKYIDLAIFGPQICKIVDKKRQELPGSS